MASRRASSHTPSSRASAPEQGVTPPGSAAPTTSAPQPEDEVIVDEYIDVPANEFELITEEPSEDVVWIPGYWERDLDKWTWQAGRWVKPPHKKAHWENGYWKWETGKWHWQRGHWALGDEGYIVDEFITIPRTLEEERPGVT